MAIDPRFRTTNALASALARIERARGFIEGARLSEDWIVSMQAWARIVEAHHSTRLAGLGLTLDQSERILAGVLPDGVDPRDVGILRSCGEALGALGGSPPPTGIDEAWIVETHSAIVGNPPPAGDSSGGYRTGPGDVGDPRTGQVVFTPPRPESVPRLLSDLIAWLTIDHGTDGVTAAGIAQYLLLQIRPFEDGNGRTARLLTLHCLNRFGYGMRGLYSLSESYDRDRSAYLRAIRGAGERGDLTIWLEYFSETLALQTRDLQERVERVIRRDQIARMHPLSQRQRLALAHALVQGGITFRDYERLCPGVSRSTLAKDLRGMVERSLFELETSGRERYYRLVKSAI